MAILIILERKREQFQNGKVVAKILQHEYHRQPF